MYFVSDTVPLLYHWTAEQPITQRHHKVVVTPHTLHRVSRNRTIREPCQKIYNPCFRYEPYVLDFSGQDFSYHINHTVLTHSQIMSKLQPFLGCVVYFSGTIQYCEGKIRKNAVDRGE